MSSYWFEVNAKDCFFYYRRCTFPFLCMSTDESVVWLVLRKTSEFTHGTIQTTGWLRQCVKTDHPWMCVWTYELTDVITDWRNRLLKQKVWFFTFDKKNHYGRVHRNYKHNNLKFIINFKGLHTCNVRPKAGFIIVISVKWLSIEVKIHKFRINRLLNT